MLSEFPLNDHLSSLKTTPPLKSHPSIYAITDADHQMALYLFSTDKSLSADEWIESCYSTQINNSTLQVRTNDIYTVMECLDCGQTLKNNVCILPYGPVWPFILMINYYTHLINSQCTHSIIVEINSIYSANIMTDKSVSFE